MHCMEKKRFCEKDELLVMCFGRFWRIVKENQSGEVQIFLPDSNTPQVKL